MNQVVPIPQPTLLDRYLDQYEKYMKNVEPLVAGLCKRFDQKKAAWTAKNTSSKTGKTLNTKKLANYLNTDNLMIKKSMVKMGEGHGAVIFLDWSGSIRPMLRPMILQACVLARFCRHAKIPFKVMTFRDVSAADMMTVSASNKMGKRVPDKNNADVIRSQSMDYCHIEHMSSQQTEKEFREACEDLFLEGSLLADAYFSHRSPFSCLGSTPLNNALLYTRQHLIPKMIREEQIQNATVFVITDGDATDMNLAGGSIFFEDTKRFYDSSANYGMPGVTRVTTAITKEMRAMGAKVIYIRVHDEGTNSIFTRAGGMKGQRNYGLIRQKKNYQKQIRGVVIEEDGLGADLFIHLSKSVLGDFMKHRSHEAEKMERQLLQMDDDASLKQKLSNAGLSDLKIEERLTAMKVQRRQLQERLNKAKNRAKAIAAEFNDAAEARKRTSFLSDLLVDQMTEELFGS